MNLNYFTPKVEQLLQTCQPLPRVNLLKERGKNCYTLN